MELRPLSVVKRARLPKWSPSFRTPLRRAPGNMDMALKSLRSILVVSFIVLLLGMLLPAETVRAFSASPQLGDLPDLLRFVEQVKNGQAGELRGLYVPELFAIPVVQQPVGDHEFISPRHNILTQFSLASRFGSTGLLAHNY